MKLILLFLVLVTSFSWACTNNQLTPIYRDMLGMDKFATYSLSFSGKIKGNILDQKFEVFEESDLLSDLNFNYLKHAFLDDGLIKSVIEVIITKRVELSQRDVTARLTYQLENTFTPSCIRVTQDEEIVQAETINKILSENNIVSHPKFIPSENSVRVQIIAIQKGTEAELQSYSKDYFEELGFEVTQSDKFIYDINAEVDTSGLFCEVKGRSIEQDFVSNKTSVIDWNDKVFSALTCKKALRKLFKSVLTK